jgi:hypothetical protein
MLLVNVAVAIVTVMHGMNSIRYIIVILPLVLCGCETRSVTLTEEHELVVVGCRVLRKIFGPKRDDVTYIWCSCMIRIMWVKGSEYLLEPDIDVTITVTGT